ncbi:MAG: hypothetical protein EAZ81_05710 [Verrucomicrobia bacterium]|nr:MAG: hypothetical protein EAZ81_05710 [Verrucomicrobiota bacterium]
MTRRCRLLLCCLIPLLLIFGGWGWLHLWSASWEKRWVDFRHRAEAEGEDFSWHRFRGCAAREEENFFRHPWVMSLLDRNQAEHASVQEASRWLEELWFSRKDDETLDEQVKKRWLNQVAPLLQEREADLNHLCVAAMRPVSGREFASWWDMTQDQAWPILSKWANLLMVRCHYRSMSNDREGMESDVRAMMALARHAQGENHSLSFVVGLGMMARVKDLAKLESLDNRSGVDRAFWYECLCDPVIPMEQGLLEVMRSERNGILSVFDDDWQQSREDLTLDQDQSIWLSNHYVQKALHASSKLMLCKDFQQSIASPHLRGERIEWTHFAKFERRIKALRKKNAIWGRGGILPWSFMAELHGGVEQMERDRRSLRQKFSQST